MSYAPHFTPASLPSDYATLSRYSTALSDSQDRTGSDEDEDSLGTDGERARPRTPRRLSFPTPYIRPPQPSMGPGSAGGGVALETTPLLVPRINEELDGDNDNNPMTMFWEELRILTRYTLPVYGFVLLEPGLIAPEWLPNSARIC